MEFIPVPGCARIAINLTLMGQKCANVFHVEGPSTWDETSLGDAANIFMDWYVDSVIPQAPSNLSLNSVTAVDLTEQNSTGVEIFSAPAVSGGGGEASLPGNVTFTVKWLTLLRGRSYRGRTYHVGVRPGLVSGNTLTSSALTVFQTAYSALLAETILGGLNLVVVSRFENKLPRTVGVTTPITGLFIEGNLDSQRRRLNLRGE